MEHVLSGQVLVVDAHIPTPNRDYGSLRMYNLLVTLRGLFSNVTFGAGDLAPIPACADTLLAAGVDVLSKPESGSIEEHLRQRGDLYSLVILSRVDVAEKYIGCVRKYAPQAEVWFDTVDLHFLREYRGAKITGNATLLKKALETKKRELAVLKDADLTLVVSPAEKRLLEDECTDAEVHVMPPVHALYGSAASFARRKDVLFVGSFNHLPNIDAVTYFTTEVLPLIRESGGGIKTYIVGADPPREVRDLGSDDVIVTGHVPDIAGYFGSCRLSIAPIRFGAGVKGKVLTSLSYGVPVVASTVAVEGLPLQNGRDVIIADNPQEFCDSILRVNSDETLWNRLSQKGFDVLAVHFSRDAVRTRLEALVGSRKSGLKEGC